MWAGLLEHRRWDCTPIGNMSIAIYDGSKQSVTPFPNPIPSALPERYITTRPPSPETEPAGTSLHRIQYLLRLLTSYVTALIPRLLKSRLLESRMLAHMDLRHRLLGIVVILRRRRAHRHLHLGLVRRQRDGRGIMSVMRRHDHGVSAPTLGIPSVVRLDAGADEEDEARCPGMPVSVLLYGT